MSLQRAPWKVVVTHVLANAIAVALTVLILPGVSENTARPVLGYLALGVLFGLINTFVKPAAQFLALPFLLGSMGFVVILIDVLVFFLLDELTPGLLSADGALWIVIAGVLLGLLSWLLDNLLGLTRPIVLDHREEAPA
ncbi:MAG: phage holin family protein [Solirubrobacteraceae bacterium]|nr:phage holin family protein [Solirubrobacteraceae bacterium]